MHKQGTFDYDECELRTVANTVTTIPAGRHITIWDDLKARVVVGGSQFDIPFAEFARLRSEGKVR